MEKEKKKEPIKVLIVGYPSQKAILLASELVKVENFEIILEKGIKPLSSYEKDSIDVVVELSESSEIMLNYLTYLDKGWPFILETKGVDYDFLKKQIEGEKKINALFEDKISKGRAVYQMALKSIHEKMDKKILDQYDEEVINDIIETFHFHHFVNKKTDITDFCLSWTEKGDFDMKNGYKLAINFINERKFYFTGQIFNMVDVVTWNK